jgi:hypothetical protein
MVFLVAGFFIEGEPIIEFVGKIKYQKNEKILQTVALLAVTLFCLFSTKNKLKRHHFRRW